MRAFHPLADIFPLIEGDEFEQLVASIKASGGPREPIVTCDDMILDGRNRARACDAVGIEPTYIVLSAGADPLTFVIDKNLRRRHLNESQRAMAAAKLGSYGHGGDRQKQGANLRLDREGAAKLLNVSARTVDSAARVQAKAHPDLIGAVERGRIAVSVAAQAVDLPPNQQRELAQQATADRKNVVRTTIKKLRREKREADLAKKQREMPAQKFGVIYADPEWRFEPWSRETGMDRAADNHYPTSCAEVIAARDVPSIAADDCVLFLWATAPMLPHALVVMAAWGFCYRSHVAWVKDKIGTGYWFRNAHELLLVGARGHPPAPAMGTQWASVIKAPVGQHSEKPEDVLRMIEEYFPTLSKIELNRRGPARQGWETWGNEALPPHDPQIGRTPEVAALPSDDVVPQPAPAVPATNRDVGSITEEDFIPDFLRIGHPANAWQDAFK